MAQFTTRWPLIANNQFCLDDQYLKAFKYDQNYRHKHLEVDIMIRYNKSLCHLSNRKIVMKLGITRYYVSISDLELNIHT